MKKIGVRALAKETGYSTATVSRVLNGSKAVSAETKARVEEAIQRLNYIPNSAARALSTRRTRMIGAVIPTIDHSIFARFISSLEAALAEADYSLVIASNAGSEDAEMDRAVEFMNIGVEALVLSGLNHRDRLQALASANGTPIVCTSIYDATHDLPTVGYDNFELGAEALRYLQSFGHRHIAVVHGETVDNDRTVLRLDGIASAVEHDTRLTLLKSDVSVHGGAASAKRAFESPHRPTAILCLSDVLALGVLFEAPRHGLRIPEDASVMGFDNLEWADAAQPALTTIDLPVVDMGVRTASEIINHLTDGRPINDIKLSAAIIERDTVAPPRAK